MRAALALAAVAALLSATPAPAQTWPHGPGDGPVAVTLRVTDGGVPVEGSLWGALMRDGRYAGSAVVDLVDGAGTLHLWPGSADLSLRGPNPDNVVLGQGLFEARENVSLSIDLDPWEPSVPIDVRVTDAGSGAALSSVEAFADLLFGPPLCIGARPSTMAPPVSGQSAPSTPPPQPCDLQWQEPGRLVGRVPPGVLGLHVRTASHAQCLVAYEGQPTACRLHAPAHRSAVAAEGGEVALAVPLVPIPMPDANVEGYLVSGVTNASLPGKPLFFQGTGAHSSVHFAATMDRDGSYRLRIPAGDYTATASLCGHGPATMPFTASKGEVLRLDVLLPAADTRLSWSSGNAGASYAGTGTPPGYPECDSTPTPSFTGSDSSPSEPSVASEPEPVYPSVVGMVAIANFGGGLGPLHGVSGGEGTDGGDSSEPLEKSPAPKPSPAAPWLAAVAAFAGVALALRRRLA